MRCLMAQRDQVSNTGLRYALVEIISAVDAGKKLSDALADQSHIFPDFYVRMLRVGEATGGLPFVLNQVADTLRGGRPFPTVCVTLPCTPRSPCSSRSWRRPCW